MIPASAVTAWSLTAPWPTRAQVEQDLLLGRLIIEVANHPYLGGELVFRGGTCLHKLHLDTPRRYSEDLDGGRLRVKVEVNTHERSPARPLLAVPFTVASSWWSGTALVRTFTAPELVATKIRALYQRKKGRDLPGPTATTSPRPPTSSSTDCTPGSDRPRFEAWVAEPGRSPEGRNRWRFTFRHPLADTAERRCGRELNNQAHRRIRYVRQTRWAVQAREAEAPHPRCRSSGAC